MSTAIMVLSFAILAHAAVEHILRRRIWRAINDLRSQPHRKPKTPRFESGERRIVRSGASPDVKTVDDSGEHVRPGGAL